MNFKGTVESSQIAVCLPSMKAAFWPLYVKVRGEYRFVIDVFERLDQWDKEYGDFDGYDDADMQPTGGCMAGSCGREVPNERHGRSGGPTRRVKSMRGHLRSQGGWIVVRYRHEESDDDAFEIFRSAQLVECARLRDVEAVR